MTSFEKFSSIQRRKFCITYINLFLYIGEIAQKELSCSPMCMPQYRGVPYTVFVSYIEGKFCAPCLSSLESEVQEFGWAGRDGQLAKGKLT